jgi:hypothetical protein
MVRYKFDPEKPIISLKVRIEGEEEIKKVNMALDTGATLCDDTLENLRGS